MAGKGATPMPPWGEVFTQDEIWELVAYIKSLGKW
jgi:mono/diheme cytochrome c family protein